MKKPAPVADQRAARTRSPHSFATRNCVHCGGDLPDDDRRVECPTCHRRSEVALCEHLAPQPAWRVTRWHKAETPHAPRRRDVVAVTVGSFTVYLGRFRDALELRREDGLPLPETMVRAVEPGAEILERLTRVGSCHKCNVVFFLPDCEVTSTGPPRILRLAVDRPSLTYARPMPDPVRLSAAYLSLGTKGGDT